MLKFENGKYVEMTQEEINEQKQLFETLEKSRKPTLEEKIVTLQEENAMLTACILEMSELVYK